MLYFEFWAGEHALIEYRSSIDELDILKIMNSLSLNLLTKNLQFLPSIRMHLMKKKRNPKEEDAMDDDGDEADTHDLN